MYDAGMTLTLQDGLPFIVGSICRQGLAFRCADFCKQYYELKQSPQFP